MNCFGGKPNELLWWENPANHWFLEHMHVETAFYLKQVIGYFSQRFIFEKTTIPVFC